MSITGEAINESGQASIVENEQIVEEVGQETSGGRSNFLTFIFKKSPAIPVEDATYMQHPLNYDQRKSTARIIRGMEGIFDSLNFALVDIGMGLLEKWKERGKVENSDSV